jgi:hypothetical protein
MKDWMLAAIFGFLAGFIALSFSSLFFRVRNDYWPHWPVWILVPLGISIFCLGLVLGIKK